jgi:hypothetical protein
MNYVILHTSTHHQGHWFIDDNIDNHKDYLLSSDILYIPCYRINELNETKKYMLSINDALTEIIKNDYELGIELLISAINSKTIEIKQI